MTAAIVADGLTKWYGPRLAVDGVCLTDNRVESMALLGPNGSGKTTILRILAGYLTPSAGRVEIAGLDPISEPMSARRQVGYVAENAPLYDGMRVREFLAFMAAIKGLGRGAAPAAVEGVCARLALETVRDLPVRALSKGFRQRVSIAQALLNEPPVLILDEPTNGLDPAQIIEMRDVVRSLAGAHTIVLSSHVLSEIEKLADRVAILVEGRLLAVHALRDRGRGRRLRLRVAGDREQVFRCLAGIAIVTPLEAVTPAPDCPPAAPGNAVPGDGIYVVELDPATPAHRVAEALVGAGLALGELREEPIDLEALFLQLTGARQSAVERLGSDTVR